MVVFFCGRGYGFDFEFFDFVVKYFGVICGGVIFIGKFVFVFIWFVIYFSGVLVDFSSFV